MFGSGDLCVADQETQRIMRRVRHDAEDIDRARVTRLKLEAEREAARQQ